MSHLQLAILLGMTVALGPLALDAYLPAFPSIADQLSISHSHVGLTLSAYVTTLGLAQLVGGLFQTAMDGSRFSFVVSLYLPAVLELIESLPLRLPVNWASPWWPMVMGIEQERIHLETSSVLIRQHDLARVRPQPEWAAIRETGEAPDNTLVTVSAGTVRLGKGHDDTHLGWDNEYGDHMTEEVEMPWDWPVEVNYHEAKAFCEWKRQQTGLPIRLPTEDEWHRLCAVAGVDEVGGSPANANLHLDHGTSSCPVTHLRHGEWLDVVGNVWQWMETPTYPFDGFKVHPLYDDFTTPTFDGRHNLIKGGSWISCGNEARLSARYAFWPHFFQHAGFRYIASESELVSYHTRTLKELGLDDCSGKVSFHQGDACNLKPQFSGYDLVLAANLIDRLYRPRRFLDSIHERINDGGLLVIASPYTWLEEHTPKEE